MGEEGEGEGEVLNFLCESNFITEREKGTGLSGSGSLLGIPGQPIGTFGSNSFEILYESNFIAEREKEQMIIGSLY